MNSYSIYKEYRNTTRKGVITSIDEVINKKSL
jgi:hypothetical protein